MKKSISIIIPCYNEEEIIEYHLSKLLSLIDASAEIIVVVSGNDKSFEIASKFPIKVLKSEKGRALQMHEGSKIAKGEIIYFLHIDSIVPYNFLTQIRESVNHDKLAGCFQLRFDDKHWIMNFYGWMTRFPFTICRGGDQSLFITKSLYAKIGGFNIKMKVMEDIEILERIKKETKFHILDDVIITSARKYNVNGRIRLQLIFGFIHFMYSLGFSQDSLMKFYKNRIK